MEAVTDELSSSPIHIEEVYYYATTATLAPIPSSSSLGDELVRRILKKNRLHALA